MGLLTTGGKPMRWGTDSNNRAVPHVSAHGIQQFLVVYRNKKDIDKMPFLWGEEIEHQIIYTENGEVFLKLDASETMDRIRKREENNANWNPEYGSYMLESIPKSPYTMSRASLCAVQENMQNRYDLIDKEAGPGTFGTTLVTFPLFGVNKFTTSDSTESPHSNSLFVPDICINSDHPRFANLTENIRLRRGRKVCIQVPLYIDKYTLEKTLDGRFGFDYTPLNHLIFPCIRNGNDCCNQCIPDNMPNTTASETTTAVWGSPEPSDFINIKEKEGYATDDLTHLYTPATLYYYAQYYTKGQRENVRRRFNSCPCLIPCISHPCIYMDCMAFGMGSCCLQVTMQLRNIRQARHLYDQLAILCPMFLALSSATPFQKGLLCDSDVRWLTIAASVDDRKREEVPRILKSRYDSISLFVSTDVDNLEEFNDSLVEYNQPYFDILSKSGVDDRLAKHIAHLFIRDPLVMYDQMIDIDDNTHTEHFENIQSTNWQTVRLKPPPYNSNIGWRLEFRVMDILPTPFENAAFATFIPLLTNAIIKYNPVFYTKMSIVDENMGRAHHINPCDQMYVMRKEIFGDTFTSRDAETTKLTIHEIFNGKGDTYYGLIPLVRRYIQEENLSCTQLESYLRFLSMRAAGAIPTAAQYLRKIVLNHPAYQQDSRLNMQIAHDLTVHVHGLSSGVIRDDSYLPMDKFKE
ncbi:unnamed protein product [Phytomonas sp. Hart1]|nr:unnamed protein product [Phytomonas sp. Hart1]|eukprot:CCW69569.1 unnamed protein product [Phytomonas sp. isolate Hart1]